MAVPSVGRHEIDQSMRLARDALERSVARYRIAVFATAMTVTAALRVLGLSDLWLPSACFAVATLYAIGVLLVLRHVGNPPALVYVTLVLDQACMVGVFNVVHHFGAAEGVGNNQIFVTYILGPALLGVLFVNSLRNSATASLVAGLLATFYYVATMLRIVGYHTAIVSVSTILLVASFIGVAAARQARRNLETFVRYQLLRRYLPAAAVERVLREHPDEALAQGGRQVTVTLLASDLRGFTAMSEKLSPSDTMELLNGYHGAMIEVIERHGGAIDKFIGDGTLVVFGLRSSDADGARAAVACAKDMLEALALHNEERAAAGEEPLRMGIGVHTGPVIAGNLGIPGRRLEFTVIGDAVNTASRLEGQTKASGCEVIVSGDTVALLPETHGLRELSPVSLRGKAGSVRAYGWGLTTHTT
jgi:adenylate cyclase